LVGFGARQHAPEAIEGQNREWREWHC
jgi:hypothetical protein